MGGDRLLAVATVIAMGAESAVRRQRQNLEVEHAMEQGRDVAPVVRD